MKTFGILFFILGSLAGAGCYYDNQQALYGITQNQPCDTTNITYSGRIEKIIKNNCSSCHSTTTAQHFGNNIIIDNFEGLQKQALGGKLLDDINQLPGSNPMPTDGTRLNPCDITAIQLWVNKGTLNN